MSAFPWPKIAVVGAGAVGGYFGAMLARSGAPVILIGRPAFAEAVHHNGLLIDGLHFRETIAVDTATELRAARDAEIILFSVKTTDTEQIARELSKIVKGKPIVVSLQNGVDNIERIRSVWNVDAVAAAVYVAVAMERPGHIIHTGRGDLIIGPVNDTTRQLSSLFEHAKIPCRITDNIVDELWTKLVWNCAANAVSAVSKVTYGRLTSNADGVRLITNVVDEVLSVAKAAGIHPVGLDVANPGDLVAQNLREQMSAAMSSTSRDIAKSKKTEIDSLNGYVFRLADKLGVPAPVNHTLYTLVKFLESAEK